MKLTKEKAKENLSKLIEKFREELTTGRAQEYNEEATKISFIQPLLEDVLGWDVRNHDEVSPEEKVSKGRVDYGLKVKGVTKIYVEAKPIRADLNKHIEQAIRYGYNKKGVPFVLLTDFEGIKLFDVTVKPDARNFLKGLNIDLNWEEYLEKFDKLWLLSKNSVIKGELDKLLLVKPKNRLPVDKAILDDLKRWRVSLAKDIFKNNHNLFNSGDREKDAHFLKEITQGLLDRIIFMRSCEDRDLIHRPKLKRIFEERTESVGKNTIIFLKEEFKHYNLIFDSDLFRPKEWEDNLAIDFKVMQEIILETYNPYQFDVIPLEVLGNIYEQYLGYTVRLTDHQVKYELKPEVRKAGGVYYTPEYIVDYIVKNTVGKLIQELSDRKIKKLRILDPACGSGSFLIRAYEEMLKYYRNQKKGKNKPKNKMNRLEFDYEETEAHLTIEEKGKILQEHIFGVDIDEQAVEVTKLSLMLKMLEDEYGLIHGRSILPILDRNIRCGNSLISGDVLELKKYFGDEWYTVKPFNWEDAFRKIMVDEDGFDVVLGNPPYITYSLGRGRVKQENSVIRYIDKKYCHSSEYKISSFAVFYEKALQLCKSAGICAYIVPGTILINKTLSKIRYHLLSNAKILQVLSLKYKVFSGAEMGDCAILIVQNKVSKKYKIKTFQYKSENWEKYVSFDNVFSNVVLSFPDYRIYTKTFTYEILKIGMSEHMIELGNIARFYNGIKTGNNKKFITNKKESSLHLPVIRGRDFDRYSIIKTCVFVYFDPKKLWSNTNISKLGVKNKIIVRQTGDNLCATLEENGLYCMDTVHLIYESDYNMKFLLGLLNSKLINYIHRVMVPELGKAFAEVKIINLKRIPIPKINFSKPYEEDIYNNIVDLVNVMLELSKKVQAAKGKEKGQIQRQIEKTDREIDEFVYKLYGITDEEKKIIKEST